MSIVSALYHWPEYRAYECLGCGAMVEIPIEVRGNPEKFAIWREELEWAHKACGELMTKPGVRVQ